MENFHCAYITLIWQNINQVIHVESVIIPTKTNYSEEILPVLLKMTCNELTYLHYSLQTSRNILAPEGDLKSRGDTITLPHLADTLKRIAKDGAEGFYEGSLAEDIVADVAEAGKVISM